jgi:phosphate transport system substrate-binding protein
MVNLVHTLAESFMKKDPSVSISVTGGGSGVGIAAAIDKKTDIANASRSIKKKEIELAKKKGVELVPIVIALDGLAVIVRENLPIDSLTLDEIGKIYRGKITNWRELGGPDLEISLYGRTSASGTYIYFRDKVVKWDYSPKMKGMIGNSHIVEAIKKDKAGIGYVGVGYIVDEEGELIKGIKPLKIAGVSPLDFESVKRGAYPLTRPLYQYTIGKPKGDVLRFIQFILSEEGQKIVIKTGFYPVSSEYREENKKLAGIQ